MHDIVVIGAGIVGLASAREILLRHPHLKLAVIEKETSLGRHQTGNNSGVIHSGVYYAPGSLKARLCTEGMRETYRYCEAKGIPTERRGKVIVAVDGNELPGLEALHQRGMANGVEGLELIGPERLRELEPHCVGQRALYSPTTGIVDWSMVNAAYAHDIELAGGELMLGAAVRSFRPGSDTVVLGTNRGEIETRHVIVCAGLHADRMAKLSGGSADPRIVPFRGNYWVLRPEKRYLVRNLIYPVPDPSFPFLGVHFTPRIDDGSVWLGPNAVLAFAREGYARLDLRPAELVEVLTFRGFHKLAARYWRTGLAEMGRDFSKRAFLRSLQRYIPELTLDDLLPGPSGVRAQALSRDGHLVDDFVVGRQGNRIIHVRNAPSPAATSSLAIGRIIACSAEETFGWETRLETLTRV